MHVGSKVKQKHVDEIIAAVSPTYLLSADPIQAIFVCLGMKVTHLVVTERRLLGFSQYEVARNAAIKFEIAGVCISEVTIGSKVKVDSGDGGLKSLGRVQPADESDIARYIDAVRSGHRASHAPAPTGPGSSPSLPPPASAATDQSARDVPVTAPRAVVIGSVNEKTLEEVRRSSRVGEVPEWIAGESGNGALVAFADRCMIIKKGAMTSFMAGSLGGGRVATFMYTDITGIEYNSGMMMGVLEVLTPSYQGTANQDYWKGSLSPVNSNASSPFALSNTLPWSKRFVEQIRPNLDWMRQKIAEAKRPVVHVEIPAAPGGTLASELAKLAELHNQGLLDADEFKSAKQTLLAS